MGVSCIFSFIQSDNFSKYNQSSQVMDAFLSCFACGDKSSNVVRVRINLGGSWKKSRSYLVQRTTAKLKKNSVFKLSI